MAFVVVRELSQGADNRIIPDRYQLGLMLREGR